MCQSEVAHRKSFRWCFHIWCSICNLQHSTLSNFIPFSHTFCISSLKAHAIDVWFNAAISWHDRRNDFPYSIRTSFKRQVTTYATYFPLELVVSSMDTRIFSSCTIIQNFSSTLYSLDADSDVKWRLKNMHLTFLRSTFPPSPLALQPNSGRGHLHETFRFTSVTGSRTVGRIPWTRDKLVARPLAVHKHRKTYTQHKH
jgi:hypothetical protein